MEGTKNIKRHLVIMAGGIGSRFWPISTPEYPKQFVDVLGCGKSLLQLTFDRFKDIVSQNNVWVVTSADYKDIVYNQLPLIPKENILFEPFMRNTAPCIAYVGSKIKKRCGNDDAEIIVSPADHSIKNTERFKETINSALNFIETNDAIVTVGITPSSPHTGFGYIAMENSNDGVRKVISFKEKPSYDVAVEYLKKGNYVWNSGLFMWKLSTLLNSFKEYANDIITPFENIENDFDTDKEQDAILQAYNSVPKISVDYAIMEKSSRIYVLPSEFGWSDLGTWQSLSDYLEKDENGNAAVGNATFVNSKNCIVHTKSQNNLIVENLADTYIINTGDKTEYYKLNNEGNLEKL